MLTAGLHEDAARSAYMACFHMAQALIFERSGKVSKTHKGVQVEFFRLTRDAAGLAADVRNFLARAYEFKSGADYFTGADVSVTAEESAAALAMARRFLDAVGGLLTQPG